MKKRLLPLLLSAAALLVSSFGLWPQLACAEGLPAFGVVADIQFGDKQGSVSRDYRGSLSRLEQCVGDLNKQNLAFVIQLGDAIDGYGTNAVASAKDFDRVLSVFNRLSAPTYHALGNHCQSAGKDTLLQRLGLKSFYYTFTQPSAAGWRFVVLDGNDAGYGVIGDEQLAWFRATLSQAQQSGEKVICFCHFPLLKAAAESHRMAKADPLLAALDAAPCVVAWIAGHDHSGGYARRKGVHHITLHGLVEAPGSTAYAKIELRADRLAETGFGNEPSRDLPLASP
jgi:3',5'-cyclic AMP phosphodiesterase CpdA